MKPAQKAYNCTCNGWGELNPYESTERIIHANNSSEAKYKYFKEYYFDFEPNFIDIRVRRKPMYDLHEFQGKLLTAEDIFIEEYMQNWRSEMTKLVQEKPEMLVHIWSDEHGAYWRSNRMGYTYDKLEAGVYTMKDAWESVHHVDYSKRIEIRPL